MTLFNENELVDASLLGQLSDDELIHQFNLEVGNFQWNSSRGIFLNALNTEFHNRDFKGLSTVFKSGKLSLKKPIHLLNGELNFI
ncbi:hypothetical protein MY04_4727 [Flammeovirga sp. MY04]|uniref:hypothetical protein n=1 Tax=Flammeovirga sp. MY04 TaxID=1191459 RepID=UPI0008060DD1|nr:hypothetical protein [Flammeovirga sp. MY04]ANQ52062.1 hypothetical protein MY04_4727 [Flammeovirga sp. MY04]